MDSLKKSVVELDLEGTMDTEREFKPEQCSSPRSKKLKVPFSSRNSQVSFLTPRIREIPTLRSCEMSFSNDSFSTPRVVRASHDLHFSQLFKSKTSKSIKRPRCKAVYVNNRIISQNLLLDIFPKK